MLQASTGFTASFVIIVAVVLVFFILFFYLLVIQLYRRRMQYQREVHELTMRYEKTLLQSQLEIQEQTFRNISQEIHDNIGQVLSLAKLNLNTLQPSLHSEKITVTEELLGKAIADLRDISKSLNTEKIGESGLAKAIQMELDIIGRITNLKYFFNGENFESHLSKEVSTIIFRIVQELLNNIVKHAQASEIIVTLTSNHQHTTIEISDNGKGFEQEKLDLLTTGIGLGNIQQRCRLINGKCTIHSKKGAGTNVSITIQHPQKTGT